VRRVNQDEYSGTDAFACSFMSYTAHEVSRHVDDFTFSKSADHHDNHSKDCNMFYTYSRHCVLRLCAVSGACPEFLSVVHAEVMGTNIGGALSTGASCNI
jgi:hypothetical protein